MAALPTRHRSSDLAIGTMPHLIAIGAILVLQIFVAIKLGKDFHFDLRNYHFYGGYSLWNGLAGRDILVAGPHTPLAGSLDIFVYLGIAHLPPIVFGLAITAIHSLNGVLLYGIAWKVFRQTSIVVPALVVGCFVLLSLSNNYYLAILGVATHDQIISLLFLACCYLGLIAVERTEDDVAAVWGLMITAGFLIGMAVGFKLSAVHNAAGVFAAFLLVRLSFSKKLLGWGAMGFAAVLGYLFAAWPVMLAKHADFGNPFFPALGYLFPGGTLQDIAGLTSIYGKRTTVLDILLGPLLLLRATPPQIASFVLYVLALLLPMAALWRHWQGRRGGDRRLVERTTAFLIVAFTISGIVWVGLFSMPRFATPQFILTPLMVFLLCRLLLFPEAAGAAAPAGSQPGNPGIWPISFIKSAGIAAGFAVIAAFVSVPFVSQIVATDIQRSDWSAPYFKMNAQAIPQGGRDLVLMVGRQPVGYVIPYFPKTTRFVRIHPLDFGALGKATPGLRARITREIATHGGPIHVLFGLHAGQIDGRFADAALAPDGEIDRRFVDQALASYALTSGGGECQSLDAGAGGNLALLCPVERLR